MTIVMIFFIIPVSGSVPLAALHWRSSSILSGGVIPEPLSPQDPFFGRSAGDFYHVIDDASEAKYFVGIIDS